MYQLRGCPRLCKWNDLIEFDAKLRPPPVLSDDFGLVCRVTSAFDKSVLCKFPPKRFNDSFDALDCPLRWCIAKAFRIRARCCVMLKSLMLASTESAAAKWGIACGGQVSGFQSWRIGSVACFSESLHKEFVHDGVESFNEIDFHL